MRNTHRKHLLLLSLATIFISTSGALGKYIALPAPVTIWWRCALATIFLFTYCKLRGTNLKIDSRSDHFSFLCSALLMGGHWISYFYALQLSNVAVGMLSIFTFPVITAVIEPLFFRTKFDPIHILLGTLVLAGIYFMIPDFDIKNTQLQGIFLGVLSAILYSLRNLMLKRKTKSYNGSVLMFYQVAILSIVLAPIIFIMDTTAIKTEFPFVLLLALITTAIGHTMFVNSFRYFKVSTASIIASSQPVFGIIIAFVFLNEIPSWNIVLGGSLILATVMIESLRSK